MLPAELYLCPSVWLRKNSEPRPQILTKVYLESHKSKRSEPDGLCGLRKQVTEAKERPLELRGDKKQR